MPVRNPSFRLCAVLVALVGLGSTSRSRRFILEETRETLPDAGEVFSQVFPDVPCFHIVYDTTVLHRSEMVWPQGHAVLMGNASSDPRCQGYVVYVGTFDFLYEFLQGIQLGITCSLLVHTGEVLDDVLQSPDIFEEADVAVFRSPGLVYKLDPPEYCTRYFYPWAARVITNSSPPDLREQEVVVSTYDCPPFTMKGKGTPWAEARGVEMNAFRTAAERLRLRWRVEPPPAHNTVGEWDNATRRFRGGMMGALFDGRADVAFCGMWLLRDKQLVADLGAPWTEASVAFLAPRPGLRDSTWAGVLAPFAAPLWVAAAAAMALQAAALAGDARLRRRLAAITGAGAQKGPAVGGPAALLALGLLLLAAFPAEARLPGGRRALLAAWAVFALLLVTAYCSKLATHLTVPRRAPPLDTVHQLAAAGLSWGTPYEVPLRDIFDLANPHHRDFHDRYVREASMEEGISRLATGKYAIMGIKLGKSFVVEGYVLNDTTLRQLRPTRESLEDVYLVLATRKGSPLRRHLDATVLRLAAGGVFAHWQHLLLTSARVFADVPPEDELRDKGPQQLRASHLRAAFLLLWAGSAAAAAALAAELVSGGASRCCRSTRTSRHVSVPQTLYRVD